MIGRINKKQSNKQTKQVHVHNLSNLPKRNMIQSICNIIHTWNHSHVRILFFNWAGKQIVNKVIWYDLKKICKNSPRALKVIVCFCLTGWWGMDIFFYFLSAIFFLFYFTCDLLLPIVLTLCDTFDEWVFYLYVWIAQVYLLNVKI